MTENQLAMVSQWMQNETIIQFVREHNDANRFELVCFSSSPPHPTVTDGATIPQLSDVAKGLIYMHDKGMIHGDIKGVCLVEPGSSLSIQFHSHVRLTSWSTKVAALAS